MLWMYIGLHSQAVSNKGRKCSNGKPMGTCEYQKEPYDAIWKPKYDTCIATHCFVGMAPPRLTLGSYCLRPNLRRPVLEVQHLRLHISFCQSAEWINSVEHVETTSVSPMKWSLRQRAGLTLIRWLVYLTWRRCHGGRTLQLISRWTLPETWSCSDFQGSSLYQPSIPFGHALGSEALTCTSLQSS